MRNESMQHAVIEDGALSWRECRAPQLASGLDALVRPIVVGRCDLDVAFMRQLAPIKSGSPLGHECIGEVVEVADQVRALRPGDRVLVAAQISCGTCRMCRRGFTGRCESVPFGASFGMGREGDFGGALADLMRIPYAEAMLVPLPASMDPVATIGAADMALDAWRAVGPALQERPDARVLVVGGAAAVIGLYAAAIANALGAPEVTYWDDDETRAAHARAFGAHCVSREHAPEGVFDIIVDACGDPRMLLRSLSHAAPEALFTSVVIYLEGAPPLPLRELYFKGVTFRTGRPNVRPSMEPVLALCHSGRFRPEAIKTSVFEFEHAPEAWRSEDLRVAVTRDIPDRESR